MLYKLKQLSYLLGHASVITATLYFWGLPASITYMIIATDLSYLLIQLNITKLPFNKWKAFYLNIGPVIMAFFISRMLHVPVVATLSVTLHELFSSLTQFITWLRRTSPTKSIEKSDNTYEDVLTKKYRKWLSKFAIKAVGIRPKVKFINSPIENANADYNKSKISVYKGYIDKFGNNPSIIKEMLAHELTHLNRTMLDNITLLSNATMIKGLFRAFILFIITSMEEGSNLLYANAPAFSITTLTLIFSSLALSSLCYHGVLRGEETRADIGSIRLTNNLADESQFALPIQSEENQSYVQESESSINLHNVYENCLNWVIEGSNQEKILPSLVGLFFLDHPSNPDRFRSIKAYQNSEISKEREAIYKLENKLNNESEIDFKFVQKIEQILDEKPTLACYQFMRKGLETVVNCKLSEKIEKEKLLIAQAKSEFKLLF